MVLDLIPSFYEKKRKSKIKSRLLSETTTCPYPAHPSKPYHIADMMK
jgi:hypothetical protein